MKSRGQAQTIHGSQLMRKCFDFIYGQWETIEGFKEMANKIQLTLTTILQGVQGGRNRQMEGAALPSHGVKCQ